MSSTRSLLFLCLNEIFYAECNKNLPEKEVEIGFFIISQPNRHHNALAEFKKSDILKQAKEFKDYVKVNVYKTHQEFGNVIGHWTILPLFEKLLKFSDFSWFFFLEETTNIHVDKLLKLLSSYNRSQDIFVGHALRDEDPTIIHHFANTQDETVIYYPHFSAGFFFSFSLIKKLQSRCKDCSFSIDPKYELAKFVWEKSGVKLKHDPGLCLKKYYNCASWSDLGLPSCGRFVNPKTVYVAVKTCKKFHADRVQVVKNTWASDVYNLHYFSDIIDETIPTINLPVKNTASGHCEKTLAIMKFYVNNNIQMDWLIIVDDDTLLSFPRLLKLLACYSPDEYVAIGERYGYGLAEGDSGYNYLTGGSGMVFSMMTVKQLVRTCRCPSSDSPDDMILGLCLKDLNIQLTHSPLFHQARSTDYSSNFLLGQKHISFHKHWMIDPYSVYKTWLKETDYPKHSEL